MMTKMTNPTHHQFPPSSELTSLLKTFSSIAEKTVNGLQASELLPAYTVEDEDSIDFPVNSLVADSLETIKLKPAEHRVPVVACDMSTVKVGETVRGSVWAVRGSIVFREGDRVSATVVGPFIYIISAYTASEIVENLMTSLGVHRRSKFLEVSAAPKIVSNLFEKLLQLYAGTVAKGGLLLVDGALTAGPLDSPSTVVEKIVENAVNTGIGAVAFSKSTTLMLLGRNITTLAGTASPPYVIKLSVMKDGTMVVKNANIYVARLSSSQTSFRVDVASKTGDEQPFSLLLSSDKIINGYPETLILAHQLAKLNKLDVLSIRTRLECLTKLKPIQTDVRRMLFTPLNG
ncbi:MAG: DNA double-strand break repair nuclease NurA [Candidatus Caldarchaeum sp.]|nr:DNA double-strand break repair nuclease NurA [Candidatus Caldarchaeum sp.]